MIKLTETREFTSYLWVHPSGASWTREKAACRISRPFEGPRRSIQQCTGRPPQPRSRPESDIAGAAAPAPNEVGIPSSSAAFPSPANNQSRKSVRQLLCRHSADTGCFVGSSKFQQVTDYIGERGGDALCQQLQRHKLSNHTKRAHGHQRAFRASDKPSCPCGCASCVAPSCFQSHA
jgi:hypothetical protein